MTSPTPIEGEKPCVDTTPRLRAEATMAACPANLRGAPAAPVFAVPGMRTRVRYITVLAWSFALFSTLRMLAYLPTLWAIYASADSQQHSAFTWLTWFGANATMAAWLFEQDGRRVTRAVAVNACNGVMCLATLLLILAYRF
jgi:hypothetical protein